jgi:hypothetical protein
MAPLKIDDLPGDCAETGCRRTSFATVPLRTLKRKENAGGA